MAKGNKNRAGGTRTGASRPGGATTGGRPGGGNRQGGNRQGGNRQGGDRQGANRAAGNRDAGNKSAGARDAAGKQSARARIARMQAIEAQRRRRRLWTAVAGAVAVGVAAVIVIVIAVSGHKQSTPNPPPGNHGLPLRPLSTLGTLKPAPAPGPAGPEAVPIPSAPSLGGLASAATGGRVDGISCQTSEQTVFHIHSHLTIFVNGSPRQVPAAVGIPSPQSQSTSSGVIVGGGKCLYWLHTHAADGIVHIESPVQRTFTLGQFFDEWGQPLSSDRLGPVSGRVVVIYNGKVFAGNPRDVPLTARAQIQLEVGSPLVAPQNISFPAGM